MKNKLKKFLEGKTVNTVIRGNYEFRVVEHEGKEIIVSAQLLIGGASQRSKTNKLAKAYPPLKLALCPLGWRAFFFTGSR